MIAHEKELEHLKVILDKKPIVATWTADDLIERPETVYRNYMEHVRSFVVLGRFNTTDNDEQPTVTEYEKRLIQMVKDRAVAKGYITAEYGYGKTSTAIFIWQQCEQAEILTVPPFQIQHLDQLIKATYGWMRFKLAKNYPQLVTKAEAIYHSYVNRSIDAEARTEQEKQLLQRIHAEGRYNLGLRDLDYLKFFEEMTTLAQEAHYQGLVVIADELQQYLGTDRNRNALFDLFNLIQALSTRRGYLPFALIFVVAQQDLGLMNEQRSDLVQRLKSDKLALDLGQIYNQTFARNLWNQLAHVLGFAIIKDRIVAPETLDALGQISARVDLANGPRTVIDVFQLMSKRYTELQGKCEPFSPIDLVNAFLHGDISYDNTAQLQNIVNGHLAQPFVQENASYQNAIKLMGAFPIGGLSRQVADKYITWHAIEDLTAQARGDIVTYTGGGFDEWGQAREMRALLIGLEDHKINSDWLTTTLREFRRSYHEQAAHIRNLAIQGFSQLLKNDIFRDGQWKQLGSSERTLTHDRSYIFEGAFTTTRKNYPERRLHIRILYEEEVLHDRDIDGDIAINFHLKLYDNYEERERLALAGQISQATAKTTIFTLNLSHHSGMEYYHDLNTTLGQVVAPSTMNPILLLSLYAYLDKKRETGVMPKDADEMIRNNFQPLLLDHALQELFNVELGEQMNNAVNARIVEEVVKKQLEISYPEYKTLMTNTQWKHGLRDYRDALNKLSTAAERQGKQPYEGNKQDLVKLFGRTAPAMDTFVSNYPLLIKREAGAWRFTPHPLETRINEQIKKSMLTDSSRAGQIRHYMTSESVMTRAKELGYREDEVKEVIELLEMRGLISIERNRTRLVEEVVHIPLIEELQTALNTYKVRLNILVDVLPQDMQLADWARESDTIERKLRDLADTPDDQQQIRIRGLIDKRQEQLTLFTQTEISKLFDAVRSLLHSITPSLSIEVLEKSLNDGLFSAQLDTQRMNLLKDYQECSERLSRLVKQLNNLQADLSHGEPLVSKFAQSLEQYRRSQKELRQPQERMAQIKDSLYQYSQARQLLLQAQNLTQRLQNAPSDIASSFAKDLDEWALQVKSDLSSKKLNGLKQEGRWREWFDLIERALQQRLQEEEARFVSIQTDYRTFLQEAFPQLRMWSNIVFNVTQPQDSYARLWEGVHAVLQAAANDINAKVQAMRDRTVRLINGLDNLPQSQRKEVQARISSLRETLNKYLEGTGTWVTLFSTPDFIQPVREQGMTNPASVVLQNVITIIIPLIEQLPKMDTDITQYEQYILAATLTPMEEKMLIALRQLQQETNERESIELGSLLQSLVASQSTNWQTLAMLYSKQRISIRIALIGYDQ